MEDYYNDIKLSLHWFPFMPIQFLIYIKVFMTGNKDHYKGLMYRLRF